jgi:hypothetical protein
MNWPATKLLNAEFNPEVDGFESFVMDDGSTCEGARTVPMSLDHESKKHRKQAAGASAVPASHI